MPIATRLLWRHAVGEVSCEVVNCNKLNKVLSVFSSSFTAPTAVGMRQEVEQIRANVFYSTFLNVFYFFSRTFFALMVSSWSALAVELPVISLAVHSCVTFTRRVWCVSGSAGLFVSAMPPRSTPIKPLPPNDGFWPKLSPDDHTFSRDHHRMPRQMPIYGRFYQANGGQQMPRFSSSAR